VIEFKTDAHEKAYHEVLLWVTQLFGESAWVNDERPTFRLPIGQAGLSVTVETFGDDAACVDFYAWLLEDTVFPTDAHEWALRVNSQYRFGALNIQPDGLALVEHVALFHGMTKTTFSELAHMIAGTTDEVLLEFGSRFMGGNLVE